MTDRTIHNAHEHELISYLDILGLDYTPFIESSENVNFYSNPDLIQQLNLIHHLLESSNLIILLLGSQGSGKSTLLQQTINNAGPNWVITRMIANAGLSGESILHSLAETYDLQIDSGSTALLYLLDEQFASMTSKGGLPILMIDDAHQLSADALQFLINCSTGIGENNGKCHIILTGDPDLENIFNELEINAANDERFHLNRTSAFTNQQTQDYVLQHLQSAGMTDDKTTLIQDCLDTIYKQSNGIPAEINKCSHLAFMDIKRSDKPFIEVTEKHPVPKKKAAKLKRIPVSGFLAGLFIVLGLAAIIFLQEQINGLFKADGIEPSALLDNLKKPKNILSSEKPSEQKLISDELNIRSKIEPEKKSVEAKTTESKELTDIKPDEDISIKTATLKKAGNDSIKTEAPIPPASIKEKQAVPIKTAAQKQPVKKAVEKTKSAIDKPLRLSDRDWILKQDPKYFSLQILGSRNEHILKKYIKDNRIAGIAKRYNVKFKGSDWYVLIYGTYKTRDIARAGIKKLQKSMRESKPWIRPLKDIQSEIRKGTK